MAAEKALLRAAGFLEKSTATEHATPVDFEELVFLVGYKGNRFVLGDNEMDKIVALLLWMARISNRAVARVPKDP